MAKKELQSQSKITFVESPKSQKQGQIDDFWMDVGKLSSLGFNKKYSTEKIIKELCK